MNNKRQVVEFFCHLENSPDLISHFSNSSEIKEVIQIAERAGFIFSESDLRGALNDLILNAQSLPRPWGWPIARKLGLVRT